MLSEEEKKAIKYFYNLRSTIDESYMLFDEEINVKCGKETIKQISLVLNLITKLQKENEYWKNGFEKELEKNRRNTYELLKQDLIIREKDKQIDLMAYTLQDNLYLTPLDGLNKEELKQYFETKAKKGE